MRDPTMISAPPVAHPGMEANMGAKKMEMKNMIPITIAVIPVLPPSDIEVSYTCLGINDAWDRRTTDASRTFDESSNWATSYKSSHANTECIDAICSSRPLKVESNRIAQSSKFGHGVQSTVCKLWASGKVENAVECVLPSGVCIAKVSRIQLRKETEGRTQNIDVYDCDNSIPHFRVTVVVL